MNADEMKGREKKRMRMTRKEWLSGHGGVQEYEL